MKNVTETACLRRLYSDRPTIIARAARAMSESTSFSADTRPTPAPPCLADTLAWLATPLANSLQDEFAAQSMHLRELSRHTPPALIRTTALDTLYTRSLAASLALAQSFTDSRPPVSRKVKNALRAAQSVLHELALTLLSTLNDVEAHLVRGLGQPAELTLWRALHILDKHFLLSALASNSPGRDTWLTLHRIFTTAQARGLADAHVADAPQSIRDAYFSCILLSCAQPATLSAREILFVVDYLARHNALTDPPEESNPVFTIEPWRDTPISLTARQSANSTNEPPSIRFSCKRLTARLRVEEAALSGNISAHQLNLPEFAATPAGRSLLRRLSERWSAPARRRFPRRRQGYRALLLGGLDNLIALFRTPNAAPPPASQWIIINESPDGYAVMHVSGETTGLEAGEIAALLNETGDCWQICLIRRRQSENQEHLELGLQILATTADSTTLLQLPPTPHQQRHGALLLPHLPPLRSHETLVTASDALPDPPNHFLLMIEKTNLAVREMRSTAILERSERIAIFSIEEAAEPPATD